MDSARIEEILRQPGSVLLCGSGTWMDDADAIVLHEPEQVAAIHTPGEVADFVAAIEAAQKRGQYVISSLSYEAGAAYGLPNHPPLSDRPLGWMAAYAPGSMVTLPAASLPEVRGDFDASDVDVRLNVTREEYVGAIARIKELIASGDTYQVNYTCRARFEWGVDPLHYFLEMTGSHPVPYAAWINAGDLQILSMSPELFMQRRGDIVSSKPMKGTRGRGRTLEEDEALAREMTSVPKDRAENLMIVDMVRNDIGRFAEIGSVEVPALFTPEKYRTVWQMTTTVTGRVPEEVELSDIFAATFPGASITGAPKHRTMEIIQELEPDQRGVYCGAIGLFMPAGESGRGDFTCNLPIRTLVHRGGHFKLGIGAGIVWDSDPQSEYEETLLKSHFAFKILPDLRLFETMLLSEDGEYAFLEGHLDRLQRSAEYWDYPCEREAVRQRLDDFAADADAPIVVRLELDQYGQLRIETREMPQPPEAAVDIVIAPETVDETDRIYFHKTTLRELYDRELHRARGEGYFEAIFRNFRGHITEGCITNLFVRQGEQWLTPPVSDGLLPGVWRAHFIKQVGAVEQSLTSEDLAGADEIVIGNSVRGRITVGRVCAGDGSVVFASNDTEE
ncbi:MAG: aminodeoxychorismate synthase component I [Armatimonadota bacterium]